MLHRLAIFCLQLVTSLIQHTNSQILELLAHHVQLLLKLLLPQTVFGFNLLTIEPRFGITLLFLVFQRVSCHLSLHFQGSITAVSNEIGYYDAYHESNK